MICFSALMMTAHRNPIKFSYFYSFDDEEVNEKRIKRNKKVFDLFQCSDDDSQCLAVSEDALDVNCYCPNGKVIIDDDRRNDGDDQNQQLEETCLRKEASRYSDQ